MQSICGFLLYFIVPKFEAIFKDFGVALPPMTMGLIESEPLSSCKYGLVTAWIPPIEILLLIFLPFSFAGWVNYDVPFFDRLLKRRHLALILRSLSLTVDSGKPIELGLSILASHYPTWWVRRKLIKVDEQVRHGESWIDALWRQGLIRPTDAEVLASAERGRQPRPGRCASWPRPASGGWPTGSRPSSRRSSPWWWSASGSSSSSWRSPSSLPWSS